MVSRSGKNSGNSRHGTGQRVAETMFPFLTAFDPLDESSGSIDPLGCLQSYESLANMLLPGITTLTRRSRYLSLLCAALANAEARRRFPPGAAGATMRRKAVEPFERLWALACIAAEEEQISRAADGLLGVTYARRAFRHFAANGRRFRPEYRLLKMQSRAGAVGTYWNALAGGELVDPDAGALTPEGRKLAGLFPPPPLATAALTRLADPRLAGRVSLTREQLQSWARRCHLGGAHEAEKRELAEALCADPRRECVAAAMQHLARTGQLPQRGWSIATLKRLGVGLGRLARTRQLALPQVVRAAVALEQFHEAALAVFEFLLWWGTEHPGKPLDTLLQLDALQRTFEQCRETGRRLLRLDRRLAAALLGRSRQTEPGFVPQEGWGRPQEAIRRALRAQVEFASVLVRCQDPAMLVQAVLDRHREVQSGKFSQGVPKQQWIVRHGRGVSRPEPRFQRLEPPPVPRGRRPTHPYRMEQFAHMLRENGVLPEPSSS